MEALIYTPSVRKNDIMQALCDFYSFQFNLTIENESYFQLINSVKFSKTLSTHFSFVKER